jgi:hypothetical protein
MTVIILAILGMTAGLILMSLSPTKREWWIGVAITAACFLGGLYFG